LEYQIRGLILTEVINIDGPVLLFIDPPSRRQHLSDDLLQATPLDKGLENATISSSRSMMDHAVFPARIRPAVDFPEPMNPVRDILFKRF